MYKDPRDAESLLPQPSSDEAWHECKYEVRYRSLEKDFLCLSSKERPVNPGKTLAMRRHLCRKTITGHMLLLKRVVGS